MEELERRCHQADMATKEARDNQAVQEFTNSNFAIFSTNAWILIIFVFFFVTNPVYQKFKI